MARKIYDYRHKGQTLSLGRLLTEVTEDKPLMFTRAKETLQKIVKDLGFTFGQGDPYAHMKESDAVVFKRISFVRQYLKLKNEENPRPLVYLDETWVNVNGKGPQTWIMKGSRKSNQSVLKKATG